ncbi:glycosyltransferase family 4 protein [Psychromonas sp. PT13]|uniref:glycosyltransferase family 4 protein n=1 Tax=Psychromonas sp. PT13 TaxID=3439547 RepID=UPI003EB7CF8C
MANAGNCHNLTMVAASPVPFINNVDAVYAPKWLQKLAGKVGARLLYFCWLAIKNKPDVLVGFHLLLNGLFVAILAKIIGAKSVYICGGGPREVAGGGVATENRIFSRIGQADYFIEAQLLKAVNEMDLVVSMGSSAIEYFKEKGVSTHFEIVPGGFDNFSFTPSESISKEYDLILIGRLSDIKRVDRFLHAIKIAKEKLPNLNAVVVGDGPNLESLQALSVKLDISSDVDFVGWQNDVHIWLQKSKCFVLTSDSEGLSQALIQAMMTGLAAITSDVGDLDNILENGKNGYLIFNKTEENFAESIVNLLGSPERLNTFSKNSLKSAEKYSISNVESEWNRIFSFY